MKCLNCGNESIHPVCCVCGEPVDVAAVDDYIHNAKLTLSFFLTCQQWSGVKNDDVEQWLKNFGPNLIDQYYATRLLNQLIYYSEEDIELLLYEGIFNKILLEEVYSNQIDNRFTLTQRQLESFICTESKKTLFMPLLDDIRPGKSGDQISRILQHKLHIPTEHFIYPFLLTDDREEYKEFKRLIIVDDCVGSGDQLDTFWSSTKVAKKVDEDIIFDKGPLLREWCKNQNIIPYYLSLVGYSTNIEFYQNYFPDLNIICMELLTENQRVFSENSTFWVDNSEKDHAIKYFKNVCNIVKIPLYGHRNLDFAVIMHKNIPDWALPIFWKTSPNRPWSILMQRKDS